jgi:hypothetical protein
MNARIAAALVASIALSALAGCASTTPTAAAPSPVVAFAVPARTARTPSETSRFELPAYQMRIITADTRPFAVNSATRPPVVSANAHTFAGRH